MREALKSIALLFAASLMLVSCSKSFKTPESTEARFIYSKKGLENGFQASTFVLDDSFQTVFSRPKVWDSTEEICVVNHLDSNGIVLESNEWDTEKESEYSIDIAKGDQGAVEIFCNNNSQKFYLDELLSRVKNFHFTHLEKTVHQNYFPLDQPVFVSALGKSLDSVELISRTDNPSLPAAACVVKPPIVAKKSNQQAEKVKVPFSITEPGLYSIANGDLNQEVYVGDKNFPKVTQAEDLARALRFITRNEEYDAVINAEDTKKAIDDFWVEIAGSQDRAKVLIREFYGRVELSNAMFTDLKPGWMTDRGMIYLVYGRPDQVSKTQTGERWIYNLYLGVYKINFNFELLNGGLFLKRDVAYKEHWNKAIRSWRMGHIAKFSL